jgi:hypothetical protein
MLNPEEAQKALAARAVKDATGKALEKIAAAEGFRAQTITRRS